MAKYMKVLPILAGLFLMQGTAFATTYYVRTGGLDAHSCPSATTNDDAHAKKTIAGGIGCIVGSDGLIVGTGTYAETINSGIPSGSDTTHRTTIQSDSGATVTVMGKFCFCAGEQYITLQGFKVDATGIVGGNQGVIAIFNTGTGHIRLQTIEVTGISVGSGVLVGTGGSGHDSGSNEFLNVHAHHNGGVVNPQLYHGIYIEDSDNDLIDGGEFDNNSGSGVQTFFGVGHPLNPIVRNAKIHDNGTAGLFGEGTDGLYYNNLVYNNTGVAMDSQFGGSTGNSFFNNTVYNNSDKCFAVGASSTGDVIKNNICYMNASAITDAGSGTVCSNNLNVTSCGATEGSTDPRFVSSGIGNFHLLAGSMAIGAGLNLSATFTTDFDGLTRTVPWDEGAYKFVAAPIVPIVMDHVRRRH